MCWMAAPRDQRRRYYALYEPYGNQPPGTICPIETRYRMQQRFRRWLDDLPLSNPLERQQAGLLQAMLLIILGGCVAGLLISAFTADRQGPVQVGIVDYTFLIVCMLGGFLLLRRGRFRPAVALAISGIVL